MNLFREKDFGNYFSYRPTSNEWAISQGLTHEIDCGEVHRFARVLKTVAHVAIDEAADGTPVIEKWEIRHV
jgi:hypothetical protein